MPHWFEEEQQFPSFLLALQPEAEGPDGPGGPGGPVVVVVPPHALFVSICEHNKMVVIKICIFFSIS